MTLPCVSCGGAVAFKSRFSVFAVCSYCQTMLVRHDLKLELGPGKMIALPQDMSLLQLGARGVFDKVHFEIVGRLKIKWENGLWNEWYCVFEDGRDGWLAEAQGFFAVSFRLQELKYKPNVKNLKVGETFTFDGKNIFKMEGIKEVHCIGSEGELPFKAEKGVKMFSADFVGADSTFASVEIDESELRVFTGKYVELEHLKMSGLRELEGWT